MEDKSFYNYKDIATFKRDVIKMFRDASQDTEKMKRFTDFILKFHHYSFFNKCLILEQKPDVVQVMGARQWEGTFKRTVKEDEKPNSIIILAPIIKKIKDLKNKDKNGKPKITEKLTGFTPVKVYDLKQTDGADIEVPATVGLTTDDPEMLYKEILFMLSLDKYIIEEDDMEFETRSKTHENTITINKGIPLDAKIVALIEAVSEKILQHDTERFNIETNIKRIEKATVASIVGNLVGKPINTWEDISALPDPSITQVIKATEKVAKLIGESLQKKEAV